MRAKSKKQQNSLKMEFFCVCALVAISFFAFEMLVRIFK